MRLILLVFAMVGFSATSSALGAEFSYHGNSRQIQISGVINTGDYDKFLKYLLKEGRYVYLLRAGIVLKSSGGNVREALKFANLFDKFFVSTFVLKGDICSSACFLIWSGGAMRTNQGSLGIHRLTMVTDSIDIRHDEAVNRPVSQSIDSFLVKVGIPRKIIDKMQETSPKSLFLIDNQWEAYTEVDTAFNPAFIDVAEKVCGPEPVAEAKRTGVNLSTEKAGVFVDCAFMVQEENQNLHMHELLDELIPQLKLYHDKN